MKKHRQPGPAATGPGPIMRKILPCGAMLAVLAWPGLAPGQTLVEPPPVESFTLDAGANGVADDDSAIEDLYRELVENAGGQTTSPSVTGTPPLPPGTPVRSQTAQQNAADSSSASGAFPPAAEAGQGVEFAEPIMPPSSADDPFRPAANQEPASSMSSPLSPPPESGGSFPPPASSQAGPVSVPLGRGATLPQTDGSSVSGTLPLQSQPQYMSEAPEPQFDAGSSRWVQPEIGQTFSAGPAPAPPRPNSVSTIQPSPSETLDAVLDGEAEAPPSRAGAPAPSTSPTSAQTPEGREHLRSLFSDLAPADSLETPDYAAGQVAPPVPDFSGLDSQPPPLTAGQPGPIEDYEGSSSILKAGGLLTLEGHYGAAEILPPLTGHQPSKTAAPAAESPPKQPEVQARQPEPKATTSTPARSGSGSPKKSKTTKAAGSKQAPAKSRAADGSLTIINETGNPRVGAIYQSVLTRMGHQVVSVTEGTSGGTPGQTVITYRPGYRAQAQAVSRHLPGQKVLTEAKGGQAADVTVNIR